MIQPEHMDKGSRNKRLYKTLKGMGLYVVPIPDEKDASIISQIIVSADLPFEPAQPTKPIEFEGDNIINLTKQS